MLQGRRADALRLTWDTSIGKEAGKVKLHYTGISHLAMATGAIDATIAFWRDLLGMGCGKFVLTKKGCGFF